MFARVAGVAIATLALVGMGACEEVDADDPTCEPTAASVAAIFATSCNTSGCHAAEQPAVGLDLATAGVEDRLIDQAAAACDRTLVVPGDPELSFLLEKLTSSAPACGATMPIGAPLSDAEIACVRGWIASLPPGCETCGGSGCADLQSDPLHCGDCGVACPTGATCEAGACACGAAESACGDACVDTQSNAGHCGQCGMSCSAEQVCSLGECKVGCDNGLTQCGQSCVDTQADANHCGECERDCGTGTCAAGACDCGNGIDPQTDPDNCGTCGNVCPPGQTCAAGMCMCGNASVSFSGTIEPILATQCAGNGCHGAPMPKAGLDLRAGSAYAQLVNVTANQCDDGRLRVAPGNPAQSYLLDKILNVDLCSGTKMPKMGTVPDADIEAISNWICGGALDN